MRGFVAFLAVTWSSASAQGQDVLRVPFDTLASRHMIVDVTVNGKGPFTLIFDTGAPTTLVSRKLATDAGLMTGKEGGLGALFGNYGQKKIQTLALGLVVRENLTAVVMDHPIVEAIAKATGKRIDGIVGFDVFGRYRTTIDYRAKSLEFAPGKHVPQDMMAAMMRLMMPSVADLERVPVVGGRGTLGLRAEKRGDEAGVAVTHVFADGPAAQAGLKVGDRILTIDSRWTDDALDCAEALRHAAPGSRVRVEFLRDGKKQSTSATLAPGV